MRIEENAKTIDQGGNYPMETPGKNKFRPQEEGNVEEETRKRRHRKNEKRHPDGGCLKLLGCLGLVFLALMAVTFCLVVFVASPLISKINELPEDFPRQIALYQLEKAKISAQDPADRAQTLQLIKSLPSWILSPFISFLSTEAETQILSTDGLSESKKVTIGNLEETLSEIQSRNNKTVSLVWDDISKNKEDLLEYYKTKLAENGFAIRENVGDYEIELGFLKNGITGAMTITDSFMRDGSSLVKMTVNYLTAE